MFDHCVLNFAIDCELETKMVTRSQISRGEKWLKDRRDVQVHPDSTVVNENVLHLEVSLSQYVEQSTPFTVD